MIKWMYHLVRGPRYFTLAYVTKIQIDTHHLILHQWSNYRLVTIHYYNTINIIYFYMTLIDPIVLHTLVPCKIFKFELSHANE